MAIQEITAHRANLVAVPRRDDFRLSTLSRRLGGKTRRDRERIDLAIQQFEERIHEGAVTLC